jgi:AcrR family transcriptional regulator
VRAGDLTEEERRRRQERIVLCAAELFLERGAENVKMTDIAEEAGIGVASLYRYFGTKSAIMLESGTLLWKDVATLFDTNFHSERYRTASGMEQIKILLTGYLQIFTDHKPFLRFLNALDAVILAERPDPETLKPYRESILNFYQLFRAAHSRGTADGSIRSGMDTEFLYRTITDFLNGAAQKFIRGEVLPEDDYSRDGEEMALFVQMALSYLNPNGRQ